MRVVDFNIHLPPAPNLVHERDLTAFDAPASLSAIGALMAGHEVAAGNLMILDTGYLRREHDELNRRARALGLKTTVMVDPRDEDAFELVDRAAAAGLSGVKLHPYLLELADRDFPCAAALARHAARLGLWIAIDCSYGTRRMYDISGVRLAIALSEAVETPIIALHGGGKLVLDVMSLAMEAPNVWLDLSFSIPFWCGSSVETDFAFAIRKLGAERCLYGSDHPYVPLDQAIDEVCGFLERHGFADGEIEAIMGGTAQALFDG